jgi:hypothetical protein
MRELARQRVFHLAAAAIAVAATSCDSLVTSETDLGVRETLPAPLAIFRGTVRLPPGVPAPTGELRAALVWQTDRMIQAPEAFALCQNGGVAQATGFVAQEVDLEARLPASFTLNVTAHPPAEALFPTPTPPPRSRWASGQVLIYEDGNGNGQLDRSRPFEAPADRVLGASSPDRFGFGPRPNTISHRIIHSELRLTDYQPIIEPGFNLLQLRTGTLGTSMGASRVPLDTVMEVELSNEPLVQGCESLCISRDGSACPERPSELPEGGEGLCLPRTSDSWAEYSWAQYACSNCACVLRDCYYPLDPALAVPPDWPCKP